MKTSDFNIYSDDNISIFAKSEWMNLKSNTLHFFFFLGAIKKEIVKPARGLSKQKATTSLNQLTEVSKDYFFYY